MTQILQGDCIKIMKKMQNESVDIVITDPPYNVGKDYGKMTNDKRPVKEYWDWYKTVFREVYRVQKNNTYLYVSCTIYQPFKIVPLMEKIGYKYVQPLVWFRPNLTGGTKLIKLPWSLTHEPILLFRKGKRANMINEVRISGNTHDVFLYAAPQTNYKTDKRFHPTQKPVKLYERIISRTPGDIILDPFAGSGAVGVAARNHNRTFIGIEINPKYVKLGRRRLRTRPTTLRQFTGGKI